MLACLVQCLIQRLEQSFEQRLLQGLGLVLAWSGAALGADWAQTNWHQTNRRTLVRGEGKK